MYMIILLIVGFIFIIIMGVAMIEILIQKKENEKLAERTDKIEPKHKTITGALYRDRRDAKKNT
jgi:arginine exporter protein ArgO